LIIRSTEIKVQGNEFQIPVSQFQLQGGASPDLPQRPERGVTKEKELGPRGPALFCNGHCGEFARFASRGIRGQEPRKFKTVRPSRDNSTLPRRSFGCELLKDFTFDLQSLHVTVFCLSFTRRLTTALHHGICAKSAPQDTPISAIWADRR